ncbi:hypothetical protein H5410_029286 [Solanum commersonii]|uniref:DUF7746 domain-containing protein n=1 Tax=Solanum commersonii TaxID=4109 RepID=A0A9J5Z568_SOLCO|nr:hypothetical protein H5410_029286 [Solanum commersonii]
MRVPFINDIFPLTHWDNNKIVGTWNDKPFILEFVTKPFTRMINDLTAKLLVSKNNQVNFIKQEINSIEVDHVLQNPKLQEKIAILKNHNSGRGGHILAQQGNRTLTSFNVSQTTASSSSGTSGGVDINHPMYKEFMDFMKSKKETSSSTTYSSVLIDDENIEVFDMNSKKDVILLLEKNDLRWRNEPWQIMTRYLDTVAYTATAYKYRMHYEIILSSTGCEFQHFYPANTKKVYNFSKLVVKRIISPEEWGMSTLKELDYIYPEQKVPVKYNYWDYIDGFNRVLLYENANRKHSWFIKLCANIFDRHIPNWFCKWWTLYGPTIKILPESYKKLYLEWIDISPKLTRLQEDNIFFEGISVMYFFIEFSIPWIMRWSIEVNTTSEGFPCLQRVFYTKFWSKLLQKNPEGKLHGQEILDLINVTISRYYDTNTTESQIKDNNTDPFKKIARQLQMKKGIISKSEAIALYMEEVKRDLMKNLDFDIKDDTSMASASHTDDTCLAGEGQDLDDEEEDLETILKRYQQQMEESSTSMTDKGKNKIYRKEEYDIPQHLDLLNKWTIPKISPRIIYHMAPYKDIYRFMHIGLVQVAFKPLTLRGLPESFIANLRVTDENSLSSLMLNVKLHGYDYMPGTEVVCICYRIYYKLLHTLNPMCKIIDFKNETILIETNFDKSKVVTRRPIKWEEIDFPQEWVIENATQPQNNVNTEISKIEQLNDGTVKIRFHETSNMLNDNRSMSSRISRSNSSYISPVDYIVQVPSRASTSQIRETYRCDNIKIDRDNIVKPIRRASSDLDITESEMNFPDGITDTENFIEGEPSNKKEFYDSLNKISEKYARKSVQRMFYYPRPTPQDVLLEEHEHIITNSYNGKEIYEWNIDGYTDRQIFTTVHRMLMYSTICKTNKNSDKTIADMITADFTGQLKGWWDNYLNQTQRDTALMAVKQEGDQITQNAVYTLVLNIIEHFSRRWSDNSETIRTLLQNLRCKSLTSFRYYKDVFCRSYGITEECNSTFIGNQIYRRITNFISRKESGDPYEEMIIKKSSKKDYEKWKREEDRRNLEEERKEGKGDSYKRKKKYRFNKCDDTLQIEDLKALQQKNIRLRMTRHANKEWHAKEMMIFIRFMNNSSEMSLNVIDNDKVIELLQNHQRPRNRGSNHR